ncbi:MAG: RNA polymerase sigma factor [Planctomycetota bacterium]|jgi:RNA polymerase sigma-70 factor (ECF subfamily)
MTDWPEVVRRHTTLVWQTAYRLLNDRDDADDCFQETFLSAFRLSEQQPVDRWGGFLARLCTCRALDRLRRRMRESARSEATVDWSALASNVAGPAEEAQAAELGDRLRVALARLPDTQASVVCLRCLNGLSYQDIGEQLGLDAAAVRRLLHRARVRLRDLLGPARAEEESEVSP